jgi:hypothetical protein
VNEGMLVQGPPFRDREAVPYDVAAIMHALGWSQRLPRTSEPHPADLDPSGQSNPRRIGFLMDHQSPCPPWENESPQMNAAIPERRPATEEISGVIERVTSTTKRAASASCA